MFVGLQYVSCLYVSTLPGIDEFACLDGFRECLWCYILLSIFFWINNKNILCPTFQKVVTGKCFLSGSNVQLKFQFFSPLYKYIQIETVMILKLYLHYFFHLAKEDKAVFNGVCVNSSKASGLWVGIDWYFKPGAHSSPWMLWRPSHCLRRNWLMWEGHQPIKLTWALTL